MHANAIITGMSSYSKNVRAGMLVTALRQYEWRLAGGFAPCFHLGSLDSLHGRRRVKKWAR
jgi:hypothetical protein